VLEVICGQTGRRPRTSDPRQQFVKLIGLAGHQPIDGPRCELDGNLKPCPIHG
jgi:hypothetical protein